MLGPRPALAVKSNVSRFEQLELGHFGEFVTVPMALVTVPRR